MQIQAKWENGALHPVHPLRLKHKTVIVEIADDELESQSDLYHLPDDVLTDVHQMQERLDTIRSASSTLEDAAPELTKKQLQRMDAFAIREELRTERGHTA